LKKRLACSTSASEKKNQTALLAPLEKSDCSAGTVEKKSDCSTGAVEKKFRLLFLPLISTSVHPCMCLPEILYLILRIGLRALIMVPA